MHFSVAFNAFRFRLFSFIFIAVKNIKKNEKLANKEAAKEFNRRFFFIFWWYLEKPIDGSRYCAEKSAKFSSHAQMMRLKSS